MYIIGGDTQGADDYLTVVEQELSNYDLYVILGNFLENAVTACERLSQNCSIKLDYSQERRIGAPLTIGYQWLNNTDSAMLTN